jgi:hypothetical protein
MKFLLGLLLIVGCAAPPGPRTDFPTCWNVEDSDHLDLDNEFLCILLRDAECWHCEPLSLRDEELEGEPL